MQSKNIKPLALIVIVVAISSGFAIFLSQHSLASKMPPIKGRWATSNSYVSHSFNLASGESEAFSFRYNGENGTLARGDITLSFSSIEEPGFVRVYFYTYSSEGWSWFYLGDGYADKPSLKLDLNCTTCVYIYLNPGNTYAFNVTSLGFQGTVESLTLNI